MGTWLLCLLVLGGKQRLKVPIFMFFPLTTDKKSLLDKILVGQALLNLLPSQVLTLGLLCSSLHCPILAKTLLSSSRQNPPSSISDRVPLPPLYPCSPWPTLSKNQVRNDHFLVNFHSLTTTLPQPLDLDYKFPHILSAFEGEPNVSPHCKAPVMVPPSVMMVLIKSALPFFLKSE